MADTSSRPIDVHTEQALRAGATSSSGAVSFCEAVVFKRSNSQMIPLELDRVRELVEVGDQLRFDIGWKGGVDANGHATVPERRVHARHIVEVTQVNDDGTISGTSRFEPV